MPAYELNYNNLFIEMERNGKANVIQFNKFTPLEVRGTFELTTTLFSPIRPCIRRS